MREIIYFNSEDHFSIPPSGVEYEEVKVQPFKDKIVLSYGVDSGLPPKDILRLRMQVSQLVHGLFGSGFQSYDSELYVIQKETMKLVGFVKSRVPHLNGRPLLRMPRECVIFLIVILKAQLEYKSSLVDGLVAAMSQANMGGFVNTAFAWSWWGFEWLVQHLEKIRPKPRILDYIATDSHGQVRNLRKTFKNLIGNTVIGFRDEILDDFMFAGTSADEFAKEMGRIYEKVNASLLDISFMEKFENQIPFLQGVVNKVLSEIKDWQSATDISVLFENWLILKENLVGPAKIARDKGFHLGEYEGILEGERFEIYEGMHRFSGWVISLLACILTEPPYEYDPKCKIENRRFVLSPIPKTDMPIDCLSFPSEGVLEW
ncbi:MAG: hypothetical protein EAX95_16165, partial [Candidatus Thorarchaeota archaeon]|nr:hypothetical protein [Candidatus Thorarchaeota archaeon]